MKGCLMNLRLAKAYELSILFDIHHTVFRSHIEKLWGWDEDWQRLNFVTEFANTVTYVIEIEGKVAGYLQLLDEENRMYVQNLAVSPTFQGQGIGTQLLKDLQLRAKNQNMSVSLGVFQTNKRAKSLYEQLGFRKVNETRTHIEMLWEHHSPMGDVSRP